MFIINKLFGIFRVSPKLFLIIFYQKTKQSNTVGPFVTGLLGTKRSLENNLAK